MGNDDKCGKRKFLSLKDAHASLNRIRGGWDQRRFTPVRAYRCDICEGEVYHLTHHERSHWLINMDFRIPGVPANPETIKERIEELIKIIAIKKEQEERKPNGRGMEGFKTKAYKANTERSKKIRGIQHKQFWEDH